MSDVFVPPVYLRSAFVQTLLASSHIGEGRGNPMVAAAREVILNPLADVRLQGFYSPQPQGRGRGLVMLLHGWEGSVNSGYILRTGRYLFEQGYSVFRLNYRDHGETQHLNPGLFYAVLLDEVFGAVQEVAQYEPGLPFVLAGFSMGGNFALRVARRCVTQPIVSLRRVVSVSPVLDPYKSTLAIDAYPFIRRHFREKWSRSLMKKQALFPQLYAFEDVFRLGSLMEMTEVMIQRYSPFASAADYFKEYALLGDALAGVSLPLTIITAQDDPIIPVEDFYDLRLSPTTRLMVQRYGGHNGFFVNLRGGTWYEGGVGW